MALNEQYASMSSFTIELFRQSILTRDNTVFGSEIQAHVAGHNADADRVCGALSSAQIGVINREVLIQSQSNTAPLTEHPLPLAPDVVVRKFINIGQRSLLDMSLIEDITHAGDLLQGQGQKLVISIDACPLTALTPTEKKTLISHVYLLKDCGIEIALSGDNLSDDNTEILNTLNVSNYLRVDLQKNGLDKKLLTTPDQLDRLYDQMNHMTHTKKVRFIADRIEHTPQHVLARSLPFYFFQGDYYASPKDCMDKRLT